MCNMALDAEIHRHYDNKNPSRKLKGGRGIINCLNIFDVPVKESFDVLFKVPIAPWTTLASVISNITVNSCG